MARPRLEPRNSLIPCEHSDRRATESHGQPVTLLTNQPTYLPTYLSIFRWMHSEAERLHISEHGRVGGIILDVMSIQQDIQINKSGEIVELVEFEDIGDELNTCNILRKGKREKQLGTPVLQFLFLGNTGFCFPFAHFVTTNVQAYDIYSLFWEAVDYLYLFGFTILYTCTDGVQSNRTFINK